MARSGQSSHGLARSVIQAAKRIDAPASIRASSDPAGVANTSAAAMNAKVRDEARPKVPTRSAWSPSSPTASAAPKVSHVGLSFRLRFSHRGMETPSEATGRQDAPSQRQLMLSSRAGQ